MKTLFNTNQRSKSENELGQNSNAVPDKTAFDRKVDEKIDRDLRDSFPASDPPGWTLGI